MNRKLGSEKYRSHRRSDNLHGDSEQVVAFSVVNLRNSRKNAAANEAAMILIAD